MVIFFWYSRAVPYNLTLTGKYHKDGRLAHEKTYCVICQPKAQYQRVNSMRFNAEKKLFVNL